MAQLVRAPPCHGGGHGFESRLGRFSVEKFLPAGKTYYDSKKFEERFFFCCSVFFYVRWYGGIGRRKGLKIPRWQHRAGSSPATSTVLSMNPHFQSDAEVDSFSLPKIPVIALAEEIFI